MTRRSRPSVVLATAILVSSLGVGVRAHAQMYYQEQEVQVHDLHGLRAPSHDPSDVLIASLDDVFHDREICCGRDSALVDSVQGAGPRSLKDVAAQA